MLRGVISSWLVFFALRQICSSFPQGRKWLQTLTVTGVRFSLFHVSYETSIFNHFFCSYFNSQHTWKRRLYTKWFDIGSVCMAIGQVVSLALLSVSLVYSVQNFFSEVDSSFTYAPYTHSTKATTSSGPVLSGGGGGGRQTPDGHSHHTGGGYTPTIAPIIPGVNFPIEYVGEFWLVTFCVIVVHEFGHAAAASLERLQIQGCGTFFLLLFPGAYVKIEESVMYLPVKSQLRVYCAGVLHNLAMAALSGLLLLSLPLLLACVGFSTSTDSVVVTAIDPSSVLKGHVRVGDHIGYLNEQPVGSLADLSSLLLSEHELKPYLSAVPYGAEGVTFDAQLRQQYQAEWRRALALNASTSRPLGYRSRVYYGSGVCVPHSLLHSANSSNAQRPHHTHLTRGRSSAHFSSLACCQGVLLQGADSGSSTGTEEAYKSCFISGGSSDGGRGDLNYPTSSSPSELLLHCLSAKEVFVPRPALSSLSHGLPTRHRCSVSSDCPRTGRDEDSSHSTQSQQQQCVHPLTPAPVHLFSLRLIPPPSDSISSEAGKTVLFEGTLPELMANFEIGEIDLHPRFKSLISTSNLWIYSIILQIPKKIVLCLWLSIQLNLSVAFMNMLPVFSLDGGLACPQFARILFPRKWIYPAKAVKYFGSFLLFANGVLVLAQYARNVYYD